MKKLIIFLMLLVSLFMFSGCLFDKKPEAKPENPVTQNVQQNLVVYRAAAIGDGMLLAEKLTVSSQGKSAMENSLQALVATKPADAKYVDLVPVGTKVLGLKLENGIAYADFSKELAHKTQGSLDEMLLCYAIVNTLTEFPEVKGVQIIIEGKKVATLGGHMDLEEPLKRNTTIIGKDTK